MEAATKGDRPQGLRGADIVLIHTHLRQPGRAPETLIKFRDHGMKDDYYSPGRSRSISRSRSPQDEREYRSNQGSPSPRENGRSLHNKDYPSGRSQNPGVNSRSPSRSRTRS